MYMIANLAVGGHWPGMVNWTTPFPAEMKIDYIRAYADKGAAPAPQPPSQPPPTRAPRERESRRDDTLDGRDRPDPTPNDTDRGSRRADVRDGRDGSDRMSNAQARDDGAGSDVFTFSERSVVQGEQFSAATHQGTNAAADAYLSFPSDAAGSTRISFDQDGAGAAGKLASEMGFLDTVQTTGLHMQSDWFFQ
jgi:hypothetical protein